MFTRTINECTLEADRLTRMVNIRHKSSIPSSFYLSEQEVQAIYDMWQLMDDMEDVKNTVASWIGSDEYPESYILEMMDDGTWIQKVAEKYRSGHVCNLPDSDQMERAVESALCAQYFDWYTTFCETWKPREAEYYSRTEEE